MTDMISRMDHMLSHTDAVINLMIVDDWYKVNEQLPGLVSEVQEMLMQIIAAEQVTVDIAKVMDALKRAMNALNLQDTIQLADIWRYEILSEMVQWKQSLEQLQGQEA